MTDQKNIHFTLAQPEDLKAIVSLLANDPLGAKREDASDPLPESYHTALKIILDDPHAMLIVGKIDNELVAVAQLNFLTYLTYKGGCRAQIEGVRVNEAYRGKGIGKQLFNYLIQCAKNRGCHVIQLTTDHQRPEAYAFYEALGFKHSHAGFKKHL